MLWRMRLKLSGPTQDSDTLGRVLGIVDQNFKDFG